VDQEPNTLSGQPACAATHLASMRARAVRQHVAGATLGYVSLTYRTRTGPTICRTRSMGAEGFEPPTPSV
jgi:hypothetical protein